MRTVVIIVGGFLITLAILSLFLVGYLRFDDSIPASRLAAAYGLGSAWAWAISSLGTYALRPWSGILSFWFNLAAAAFAAVSVGYQTPVGTLHFLIDSFRGL